MEPPCRFHEPVAASKVKVRPALFIAPVRFTVPPARVRVKPSLVKEPPRLTVAPVEVIGPALDHAPPRVSVAPASAVIEPVGLVQLAEVMLSVPAVADRA